MKTVSVFMDVEDPINPAADDAALDLARLFTDAGVRGSFCVTGEKCRKLVERGRMDVIEALRPHCLGLHTDTHSYHPTTMELLADVGYDEGCRLAYETEKRGFEAFVAAFDRAPSYWGGAGNTWSPEITDALGRLGVPAFVYSQTELAGEPVHRFNGMFAIPQRIAVSENDWAAGPEAGRRVLEDLDGIAQGYVGVFVGHPTRYRHVAFWDAGYFDGHTPASPPPTDPVPDSVYEAEKANLRTFLTSLKGRHRVVGLDDAMGLPWSFRPLSQEEQADFRERTAHNLSQTIRWPVNRHDLDPSNIVAKTLALTDTVQVGDLPEA